MFLIIYLYICMFWVSTDVEIIKGVSFSVSKLSLFADFVNIIATGNCCFRIRC